MYKQLLLASTLSLGFAVAPIASAGPDPGFHGRTPGHAVDHRQDRDHGRRGNDRDDRSHWNDRKDRDDRHDRHARDSRHDRNERFDRDHRHDHRWQSARERHWQGPRYRMAPYHAPRGYSRHYWRAGERLPASYRDRRYVVNHYHTYHLHTPPRGHHWVRVDRDVVLTAVATGVVAAVVYNIFL